MKKLYRKNMLEFNLMYFLEDFSVQMWEIFLFETTVSLY